MHENGFEPFFPSLCLSRALAASAEKAAYLEQRSHLAAIAFHFPPRHHFYETRDDRLAGRASGKAIG